MKILPSNHPRVVAISPSLSANERAAMWPGGLDIARVEAIERKEGRRHATAPAPASNKPAAVRPAATIPPTAKAQQPSSPTPIFYGEREPHGTRVENVFEAAFSDLNERFRQ